MERKVIILPLVQVFRVSAKFGHCGFRMSLLAAPGKVAFINTGELGSEVSHPPSS